MNRLSATAEGLVLFVFAGLISSLTILGALGVDPATLHQPQPLREATLAHRQ